MGLADYKTYKKRQKILAFLKEEFGVTEDDLKYIKSVKKEIADNKKMLKDTLEDNQMLREQVKALADENKSLTGRVETLEKAQVKSIELTEKQKKEIEDKYNGATTPEDIVKMFADDAEEFYPNGIGN